MDTGKEKSYLKFRDRLFSSVMDARLEYARRGNKLSSDNEQEANQIAANLVVRARKVPPVDRTGKRLMEG